LEGEAAKGGGGEPWDLLGVSAGRRISEGGGGGLSMGRAEGRLVREPAAERKLFGESKLLQLVAVVSGRLQSVGMDRSLLEERVVLLLWLWRVFALVSMQASLFCTDFVLWPEKEEGSPCSVGSWPGALSGWLAWGSCEEVTMMNHPVPVTLQPLNVKLDKGSQ